MVDPEVLRFNFWRVLMFTSSGLFPHDLVGDFHISSKILDEELHKLLEMVSCWKSAFVSQSLPMSCISFIKKWELGSWHVRLSTCFCKSMSLSSHPLPADLGFVPVVGNLHVILFCQVTVFETVSLEVSRDTIFVQDRAFSGAVDLCRVQTTHTASTAYK